MLDRMFQLIQRPPATRHPFTMYLPPITRRQYPGIQLRQYATVDFLCTWIRVTHITRTAITVRRHRDLDIVRTIMVDTIEAMSSMVVYMVEKADMADTCLRDSAPIRRMENLRSTEHRTTGAGGPSQLGDAENRRNRHDGF